MRLSRLIYEAPGAIRYFSERCLWERLQNRCQCVVFQKKKIKTTRKTTLWHQLIGWFKFRAKSAPLTLVSFIFFVSYYMINARWMAQWWSVAVVNHRTWVRAPGPHPFPYIFPLNVFPYNFNTGSVSCTHSIKRPRVSSYSIKGQDLKTRVCLSQRCHMLVSKSTRLKDNWALNCWASPHNWGADPPRFAIFFTFFIFHYFLLSFKYCFIN